LLGEKKSLWKEMQMSSRENASFKRLLVIAGLLSTIAGSAKATLFEYAFNMNGPSESPTNSSLGTATGSAIYDNAAHTLALTATFAGLQANVTQTHFHAVTGVSGLPDNNPIGETPNQAATAAGTTGIAVGNTTLPGFPLGVTSGTYANTLNLLDPNIYNTAFLSANGGTAAGAEATFVNALATGKTYWNIHTAAPTGFPGGEIRGFPVLVPEPMTIGIAAMGASLLLIRRRR
jgi:hypothetical protein